jgi:hypothetical protein
MGKERKGEEYDRQEQGPGEGQGQGCVCVGGCVGKRQVLCVAKKGQPVKEGKTAPHPSPLSLALGLGLRPALGTRTVGLGNDGDGDGQQGEGDDGLVGDGHGMRWEGLWVEG